MAPEMKSSQNLNKLFWILTGLFTGMVIWSAIFKIDKSILATGELKPLGKAVIVQNRFEGKVSEIFVKNGQFIEKNEKLISFETEIDNTELFEIQTSIETNEIKIRRLSSQLKLEYNFARSDHDDPIIFQEQKELLNNELATLDKSIFTLNREKELKLSELDTTKKFITSLIKELKIAEAQYNLSENLFKKGFEGSIALMEKEAEVLKKQTALEENSSKITLTKKEIELIEAKVDNLISEFKKSTLQELVKAKEEVRLLQLKREGLNAKMREFYINAPTSGVVSKMEVENNGAVFKPGETILEILPSNRPLVFYAELPVQYVDEVNLGQLSLITLSTLDTRNQKPLEAKVSEISPDAISSKEKQPHYQVIVKFSNIETIDKESLKPGVTGQASIILGKRTVIEYFLDPIFLALKNSMKES